MYEVHIKLQEDLKLSKTIFEMMSWETLRLFLPFLTDEYIENLIEYRDIRPPACANAIFRCEHRLLIQVVNIFQSGLPLQRSHDACIAQ